MRKRIVQSLVTLSVVLVLSQVGFAQFTEQIPKGWKPCPHCLTPEQQKADKAGKYSPPGMPFNPRDLSGVWGTVPDVYGPMNIFAKTDINKVPPMTALGKQRMEASATDFKSPAGTNVTNSKDPMLICDPLGWPRWYTYNYGFEFVVLPDRVMQFIEWGHTWRTIWTDGRPLPDSPPEPRFMGWAVGHWEPDNTFVIESNGYDDRSWISEAPKGQGGYPHSEDMKVVERWKRTGYGTLESQVTLIDPKTYTKPWVTDPVTYTLLPDSEVWEYYCVPSDSEQFNQRVLRPSNGAK